MLFSSFEFIFAFLPIMFLVYFYLLSKRYIVGSKIWLVGGSLFFYSWWNPLYLPIILSSMFFNYALGTNIGRRHSAKQLNKSKRENRCFSMKAILIIGIVANLGLLGYFKYMDFFIANVNSLFGANISLLHIALPLGISFFTFQQIAYLVDSYRGETRNYNLLSYMLFVSFFPQLIAGPIVHHKEMMPQFSNRWNLVKRYNNIALGLFIFSIGLFKKVVIADAFSQWAIQGFDFSTNLVFFQAWATSLSYTFQIYFDFSGYIDMAIGAALLFNIRLPINFNSPYKALNIQDFWHRWHITLSRFLRDYVYIPFGGNRLGANRTYINLFATFLIGGLWHGASWMFIIWGAMHGGALIIHRFWQQLNFKMWNWLAWFITFNFINITWIFFRANNMSDAVKVISGMLGFNELIVDHLDLTLTAALAWIRSMVGTSLMLTFYLIIFSFFLISRNNTASRMQSKEKITTGEMVFSAGISAIAIIILLHSSTEVFLYFNF